MPTVEEKADWAEASCIFGMDTSVFREDLLGALEESRKHPRPGRAVDDIWKEIDWRRTVIPQHYPFELLGDRIARSGDYQKWLHYSFMLLFSTDAFYKREKEKRATRKVSSKIFERLTAVCLKQYLARSIVFGFPREGGVPKSLKQALKFVSQTSCETLRENPQLRRCSKDVGADVIAWHPMDSRSGQVIIMVQCTVEEDWYEHALCNKSKLDYWDEIIQFSVLPCKAVAIPYVCHTDWFVNSRSCGMLLDRLRLSSLIFHSVDNACSKLYMRKKIFDYCEKQRQTLKWLE